MLALVNYSKYRVLQIAESCFNASYVPDSCYICYRKSNYTFVKHDNKDEMYCTEPYVWSEQVLYNTQTKEKQILTTYNKQTGSKWRGFEDARFVKWNDEYYVTVTEPNVVNGQQTGTMTLLKLDKHLKIVSQYKLQTNTKIEKNWQPIETLTYNYVYSYKPFTLLNVDTGKLTYNENNNQTVMFRGSTPICRYDKYNICLVHTRVNGRYVHYIVLFDNEMNILNVSNEFCFFGARIEFCTGMKVNSDLSVELLVSINDVITYNITVTQDVVQNLMNCALTSVTNDTVDYDRFVRDALTIDNKLAALCLSTYSQNKELLTEVLCSTDDILSAM